jgi:amino acid permease
VFASMNVETEYWYFGLMCFLIYTPLCWVRNLEKFNSTHIFADVIIFVTAIVVIVYTIIYAAKNPIGEGIEVFNSNTFLNVIGFAVYSYEGIGIIIPVMDITENKE